MTPFLLYKFGHLFTDSSLHCNTKLFNTISCICASELLLEMAMMGINVVFANIFQGKQKGQRLNRDSSLVLNMFWACTYLVVNYR